MKKRDIAGLPPSQRRYLFWDLDGTLLDTVSGVIGAFKQALAEHGLSIPAGMDERVFLGPPFFVSLTEMMGVSAELAERVVASYRRIYPQNGMYQYQQFDGLESVLKQLHAAGRIMAVATSKPEVFARSIAKHSGFVKYFACIAGATADHSRTRKAEVLRYAMEQLGVTDASQAMMIGDRHLDVQGARACDMDCVGVLFGYGSREELAAADAAYIVEDAHALGKLLLG